MLFFKFQQMLRRKIRFGFHRLQHGIASFEKGGVVFVLPVLAQHDQRLSLDLKIGLIQRIGDKFRLPAFQEAVDDIYRFHMLASP